MSTTGTSSDEKGVMAETRVFDTVGEAAVSHFVTLGWVLVATIDADGVTRLRRWADDVAQLPDAAGKWLHHHEMTDDGPKLARSENFTPFHAGLRMLLTTGRLVSDAGALLGEPAVLYKEKINYKLPGGAGYAPHQDAPAYRFVDTHVSCMLAIDDATEQNGCLEVASGCHHELLPTDDSGCLTADVVASLDWAPIEVLAGQTLWFHSRTPHRSGANRSSIPRRALYPTFNAAAEGDLREEYYAHKRRELDRGGDPDRVHVSLIGDFQGRPVR